MGFKNAGSFTERKARAALRTRGWSGDLRSGVAWLLEIPMTHQQVADALGISRSTLVGWIENWKNEEASGCLRPLTTLREEEHSGEIIAA